MTHVPQRPLMECDWSGSSSSGGPGPPSEKVNNRPQQKKYRCYQVKGGRMGHVRLSEYVSDPTITEKLVTHVTKCAKISGFSNKII